MAGAVGAGRSNTGAPPESGAFHTGDAQCHIPRLPSPSITHATHRDALVRAPAPDLRRVWTGDLPDANVRGFAAGRRVRPTDHLPLSEPIADLKHSSRPS